MKMPYEECYRFEICNCNVCPLDPNMNDKEVLEGDSKCLAIKSTRIRIASQYSDILPMGGLNTKEFRKKTKREARIPAQIELDHRRTEKMQKKLQEWRLNKAKEASL